MATPPGVSYVRHKATGQIVNLDRQAKKALTKGLTGRQVVRLRKRMQREARD